MDCTEVREEFSALLDGELSPERRADVEAHLAACADCLRELDKLKRIDTMYRDLAPQEAPEDFEERVRAARRENVVAFRRPRRMAYRLWPVLAAAAMLFVVVGLFVLRLDRIPGRYEIAKVRQDAAPKALDLSSSPDTRQTSEPQAGRGFGTLEEVAHAPKAEDAVPEKATEQLRALGYLEGTSAKSAPAELEADGPPAPVPRGPSAAGDRLAGGAETVGLGRGRPYTAEDEEGPESVVRDGRAESTALAPEPERAAKQDALGRQEQQVTEPAVQPEDVRAVARVVEESEALSVGYALDALRAARAEPAPPSASSVEETTVPRRLVARARPVPPPLPSVMKGKGAAPGATVAQPAPPTAPMPPPPCPPPPKPAQTVTVAEPARPGTPEGADSANALTRGTPAVSVSPKTIGSRTFVLRDGVWQQKEYAGEQTKVLFPTSPEFLALADKVPELEEILQLGDRVILRVQETWYQIKPQPAR